MKRLILILISSLIAISACNSDIDSFLNLPLDHDWRISMPECIDPIHVQGGCEAGYAFSVVELIRMKKCIKSKASKKLNRLSVQEVISCDNLNLKCKGGDPKSSLDYIFNKGITTEECFGYSAKSGIPPECVIPQECLEKKIFPISNVSNFNASGPIMQEILFNGPVIATFDMYRDFLQYSSGMYKRQEGAQFVNKHSVLLVGYSRSGNEEYWIGMNSFGTGWGEKGYFKIPFGESGIDSNVVSADISDNVIE